MVAKGRGILRWYVFPVRPCAARLGLGGRGPGLEVADDGLVEPTAEVLDAGEPAVGLQLQTGRQDIHLYICSGRADQERCYSVR